jgi:hypothetical protein
VYLGNSRWIVVRLHVHRVAAAITAAKPDTYRGVEIQDKVRGPTILNTDKGEVGGSSPPRPTIQIRADCHFPPSRALLQKSNLPKFAKSSRRLILPAFRGWQACVSDFRTISANGTVVNDPGGPPILERKVRRRCLNPYKARLDPLSIGAPLVFGFLAAVLMTWDFENNRMVALMGMGWDMGPPFWPVAWSIGCGVQALLRRGI